ncbi:ABC transporter substrate-binding protein [Methyloraptor flagellatus]|uniref:ABC transporter substrate-binding protein n=1 Tax=Methyloraptor flagellatus TaxID=3162530 RepID=A0AAU7X7U0_9HYPH
MPTDAFLNDNLDRALDATKRGAMDRRDFLGLLATVAAGALVGSGRAAEAASKALTVANFGGDAVKAFEAAWTGPFAATSGATVTIDGAGPLPGNIKKMVDEKNVVWDVSDGDGFYALQLGAQNLVEKIDYSVVKKDQLYDWNAYEHGVGNYVYSYVLAYRKSKYPTPPKSWADFLDVKKFPGKRTLWKWFMGMPEPLLLGSGVPKDKLYPIDMDKVVKAVKSLGDNLVLWDSGGSSQQVFLDKEVDMGVIWHTRATVLEKDTGGDVTWTWADHILTPGAWVVPKGGKDTKLAMEFIASTQDPAKQVKLLDMLGNGPANPKTVALLTDEQKRKNPTSHLDTAVIRDEKWYAEKYDDAVGVWLDAIAK